MTSKIKKVSSDLRRKHSLSTAVNIQGSLAETGTDAIHFFDFILFFVNCCLSWPTCILLCCSCHCCWVSKLCIISSVKHVTAAEDIDNCPVAAYCTKVILLLYWNVLKREVHLSFPAEKQLCPSFRLWVFSALCGPWSHRDVRKRERWEYNPVEQRMIQPNDITRETFFFPLETTESVLCCPFYIHTNAQHFIDDKPPHLPSVQWWLWGDYFVCCSPPENWSQKAKTEMQNVTRESENSLSLSCFTLIVLSPPVFCNLFMFSHFFLPWVFTCASLLVLVYLCLGHQL